MTVAAVFVSEKAAVPAAPAVRAGPEPFGDASPSFHPPVAPVHSGIGS